MRSDCNRKARTGVLDMTYIERRLDAIEARIDDLCGLLGEVLERIDKGESVTEITPRAILQNPAHSHDCVLMNCEHFRRLNRGQT